jgi:hypothetical protein
MTTSSWHDANQRYLIAHLRRVRGLLSRAAADDAGEEESPAPSDPPLTLDHLCRVFGLSSFERDVLLLAAGVELDTAFAAQCAAVCGGRGYPTFSLALSLLPEPHWSALLPSGPLRHWRLIELGAGDAVTRSSIQIDESVLHYLAGLPHEDERLAGVVDEPPPSVGTSAAESALAERLAETWRQGEPGGTPPVLLVVGADVPSRRAVALGACESLGLSAGLLAASSVPSAAADAQALVRLWDRHAALENAALVVELDAAIAADAARLAAVQRFVDRIAGPVILCAPERVALVRRTLLGFDVPRPAAREQRGLWAAALGPAAARLDGALDDLAFQFQLPGAAIRAASLEALTGLANDTASGSQLRSALWDACRNQTRSRMDDLAQRLEPGAGWGDLVLPARQLATLREIAVHVRQRAKVYGAWGFDRGGARGLGISALFAGPSGTGKTMAAEVLANELALDLYRVDLSRVVSKYIGETEKNLRRIFDAAESGSAILLFDEADALFGKRSEVKDSHDRYANVEISYLLQRMECYRGLAILTTNMKSALDPAFLRRIRFAVHFPFPDEAHRALIWSRIFPAATPTTDLDDAKLARLHVSGGNIRSIAVNAAFLAAEDGGRVTMRHVLRAAQTEYLKLEKPLTEVEVAGWV